MRSKSDSAKKIRSAVTNFDIEEAASTNLEIVRALGGVTAKLEQQENKTNKQLMELIEELRTLPRTARSQRIHEEKMFASMVKLIAGYEKKAKLESDTDKKNALLDAASDLRKQAERLVRFGGGARAENIKESLSQKLLNISPSKLREAGGSIGQAYKNELGRISNFVTGRKGTSAKDVVGKAVRASQKSDEISSRYAGEIGPAIQGVQSDAGLPVDDPIVAAGNVRGLDGSLDTNRGLGETDEFGNLKKAKKSRSNGTASAKSVDGGAILNKIYDEVKSIRDAVAQKRDKRGRFVKRDNGASTVSDTIKSRPKANVTGTIPPVPESTGSSSVEGGSITTMELGQKSLEVLTDAMKSTSMIILGGLAVYFTGNKLIQLWDAINSAAHAEADAANANMRQKVSSFKSGTTPEILTRRAKVRADSIVASGQYDNRRMDAITQKRDSLMATGEFTGPQATANAFIKAGKLVDQEHGTMWPSSTKSVATPPAQTGATLTEMLRSVIKTPPPPPVVIQPITNNNVTSPTTTRQNSAGGVRTVDPSYIRHEDRRQNRTLSP